MTLQTLNNTRELAQQLRVAGGRRNSVARTGLGRPVPRAGGSPANFGRRE
jgi:hypothetical protein